ncbi:MAG: Prochlorococcus phage [Pseudomonadota bacterium]|jgi:uncharacterized protein (TIGR02466 family)
MDLVDLFPRTIAVAELQSLTPDLITKAIDLIDIGSSSEVPGDGAYTTDQQLLNRVIFRAVKAEIVGLCHEFAKAYSHVVDDIAICNSWGNVIRQGESIHYHQHSNAYISGSFYLTEGAPFSITDRERTHLFGFAPRIQAGDNPRALESFTINPKPRRIILFPSGMAHSVLPSSSQQKRYSIAFNAVPVGRIGGPTGLLDIRLVE